MLPSQGQPPRPENTLTLHVPDTDAVEVHDVFVGDLSHHAGCLEEGLWEDSTKKGVSRVSPHWSDPKGALLRAKADGSQESSRLSPPWSCKWLPGLDCPKALPPFTLTQPGWEVTLKGHRARLVGQASW